MSDFIATADYVARLARLYLSEEEKKKIADQLSAILEAAGKIQELDTTGIEPTSHVISFPDNYREDEIEISLDPLDVLKNAPGKEDTFFRVPRIAK